LSARRRSEALQHEKVTTTPPPLARRSPEPQQSVEARASAPAVRNSPRQLEAVTPTRSCCRRKTVPEVTAKAMPETPRGSPELRRLEARAAARLGPPRGVSKEVETPPATRGCFEARTAARLWAPRQSRELVGAPFATKGGHEAVGERLVLSGSPTKFTLTEVSSSPQTVRPPRAESEGPPSPSDRGLSALFEADASETACLIALRSRSAVCPRPSAPEDEVPTAKPTSTRARNSLSVPQALCKVRSPSSERARSKIDAAVEVSRSRSPAPQFLSLMPQEAVVPTDEDPFALRRFTSQQATWHSQALVELQQGAKASCWMWYVMPTPPHIVNGIEKGSANNMKFALRSDEEAHAYLSFQANGVDLRDNYFEIVRALREQLAKGKMPFQRGDIPKMRSNIALFERISREARDTELHALLQEVIALVRAREKT